MGPLALFLLLVLHILILACKICHIYTVLCFYCTILNGSILALQDNFPARFPVKRNQEQTGWSI